MDGRHAGCMRLQMVSSQCRAPLARQATVKGSASTPQRSPASRRVFRTRYKMVARLSPGTGHPLPYNPALSWRAKRIQSARTFLQSRLRAPPDRRQSPAQRWTGSGMRWIRGSLYRVSANKLSRTVTSSMSINRTAEIEALPPVELVTSIPTQALTALAASSRNVHQVSVQPEL
ncbi:unnamed protein product [Menidia menidia]|uniref:(Atlantic silverside) hypothetical protein n=1 Tax=Menidia menidia TaxID=238744 RepID=A0A8S4A8M7_9TELE|nr:unnamed protein product [Menidia menidia]